jgi:methionyl-tRNA formyltransferase
VTTGHQALRLVVCAEEAAGVQLLKSLVAAEDDIVAVLTGDGREQRLTGVASAARRAELRVLPSQLVMDPKFAQWLVREDVDVLVNVHSLRIACAEVVGAPRIGSFNLHPGPLPRYAGLNAPSWAIYNGEESHGVTVHWMDSGVDSGPIVYQELFPLRPDDTGLTVSTRCVNLGLPLVLRALEVARADPRSIPAIAQDPAARTYVRAGPPDGGTVDWARSASRLDRLFRASDYFPLASPWGEPKARLGESEIGVARVQLTGMRCDAGPGTVRRDGAGSVLVATADEWLRLVRVSVDGRSSDPLQALLDAESLPAT